MKMMSRIAVVALLTLCPGILGCGGDDDNDGEAKTETWTFYLNGQEMGTMTTYHPADSGDIEALGDIVLANGDSATLRGTMSGGVVNIRVEVSATDIVNASGTYTETMMQGSWVAANGDMGTWSATILI